MHTHKAVALVFDHVLDEPPSPAPNAAASLSASISLADEASERSAAALKLLDDLCHLAVGAWAGRCMCLTMAGVNCQRRLSMSIDVDYTCDDGGLGGATAVCIADDQCYTHAHAGSNPSGQEAQWVTAPPLPTIFILDVLDFILANSARVFISIAEFEHALLVRICQLLINQLQAREWAHVHTACGMGVGRPYTDPDHHVTMSTRNRTCSTRQRWTLATRRHCVSCCVWCARW